MTSVTSFGRPAIGGDTQPVSIARPKAAVDTGYRTGNPKIVMLFLCSLLVPIAIPIGVLDLQPHRIVLLATMPYLAARLFAGQAGRMTAIDHMVLASALWCLLAYLSDTDGDRAHSHLSARVQFSFSWFVEMYGGYLIARVGIQNPDDVRRLAKFMFFSVLACLPFAVIEAVTHRALFVEFLATTAAYDVRFGLRRAQIVFAHPILYGTFASTAMGLVWFMYRPQAAVGGRIFRAIFVFAALFLSLSMGAILSFVIQTGSIIYDHVLRSFPKRWTMLGLAVAGMYIFIEMFANSSPFAIFVRYLTFNQTASYVRLLVFEYGMDNIRAAPFFGFGSSRWLRPPGFPPSIDNFWLLIAMQFGVPAFLFLAVGVGIAVRRLAVKMLSDPLDLACRSAVLVAMGGIIVAGATVHYWQGMLSFVMFMFGAGSWLLDRPDPQPVAEDGEEPGADGQPANTPAEPSKKRYVPYGREA